MSVNFAFDGTFFATVYPLTFVEVVADSTLVIVIFDVNAVPLIVLEVGTYELKLASNALIFVSLAPTEVFNPEMSLFIASVVAVVA